MQLQLSETGDDLAKQFRKAVISGGPLKGAMFLDVSWEDVKKAAKSYRGDPRFNQFAKRLVSAKALGDSSRQPGGLVPSSQPQPKSRWQRAKDWVSWSVAKVRGRLLLMSCLLTLAFVLLSRPLFYVIIAKGITIGVKIILKRSVGILAVIIDSILEEVASQLETELIGPPTPSAKTPTWTDTCPNPYAPLMAQNSFTTYLMHALFALIGALLGHKWRAPQAARVNRLRLV